MESKHLENLQKEFEEFEKATSQKSFSVDQEILKQRKTHLLKLYNRKFLRKLPFSGFYFILQSFQRIVLHFNQFSLMKKTLLTSTLTLSLLTIGFYAASFVHINSNQTLTLETLVAKAQQMEEKKATEGRYYYQKVKHLDSNTFTEVWVDTQTSKPTYMTYAVGENEKVQDLTFVQNGVLTRYNKNGNITFEGNLLEGSGLPMIAANYSKIIGPGLKAVIEGNNNPKSLASIYSQLNGTIIVEKGHERKKYDNNPVENPGKVTAKYLGSLDWNGKILEGIGFTTSGTPEFNLVNPYTVEFYFDTNTFDVVMMRTEINGQYIPLLEFSDIRYTNQKPEVLVGNKNITF